MYSVQISSAGMLPLDGLDSEQRPLLNELDLGAK